MCTLLKGATIKIPEVQWAGVFLEINNFELWKAEIEKSLNSLEINNLLSRVWTFWRKSVFFVYSAEQGGGGTVSGMFLRGEHIGIYE